MTGNVWTNVGWPGETPAGKDADTEYEPEFTMLVSWKLIGLLGFDSSIVHGLPVDDSKPGLPSMLTSVGVGDAVVVVYREVRNLIQGNSEQQYYSGSSGSSGSSSGGGSCCLELC